MKLPPTRVLRYHRKRCRILLGFTVAELVLSMSIAALLLGGMTSALVIASRATTMSSGAASESTNARLAADQITADLNHALVVSEHATHALSMSVPDRSGDGNPETIRYAWSGTAGAPLTRQYNGGLEATVAQDIHQFDVAHWVRTALPPAAEQTSELTLISYDNCVLGSLKDYKIDQSHWCAQYFKPSLPLNALSWTVTRAFVMAKQEISDRMMSVEIRVADMRQKPTSQVLDSVTVSTSSLSGYYAWRGYSFSNVTRVNPAQGLCLVVRQNSGDGGAKFQYHEAGSSMLRNTHWLTTADTGGSWSLPTNTTDMVFYIKGTITTQGPAQWP